MPSTHDGGMIPVSNIMLNKHSYFMDVRHDSYFLDIY